MEEVDERTKKIRKKSALYDQTPDRKEARRVASIIRAHRLTLITTVKRIQSHSFDDLVEVARICCKNDPNKFLANQDMIILILAILHEGENVQSDSASEDIRETSSLLTNT